MDKYGYDSKQSDDELQIYWSFGNAEYPFMAIAPGPLWLGVVVPVWVLSMGQIELFDI